MAPKAADATRRVGSTDEYTFTAEGVTVVVPDQADRKPVRVQKEDLIDVPEMHTQSDFHPHRIVINLVTEKDADPSSHTRPALNPPVTLQVKVTPQDIAHAGSEAKVKMAYWFNGKWNVFGAKHDFAIENGYARARLAVWGDPPVGMGP